MTATGTLTVEGTYNDFLSGLTVTGKSWQSVTVQGKNLLDSTRFVQGTIIGATGADIPSDKRCRTPFYIKVSPNSSYTIKGASTCKLWIFEYKGDFSSEGGYVSGAIGSAITIVTGANIAYVRIGVVQTDGTNEITTAPSMIPGMSIQLELGSTATDYAPFVPNSPSPDYPSSIVNSGGFLHLPGLDPIAMPTLRQGIIDWK